MIATCTGCQTRYRVAPEKLGRRGARIRCQKCSEVFHVAPPEPEPEPVAEAVAFVATAVVAEADAKLAKAVAALLESWSIEARVFDDGAAALLHIHRERPDLAILGAGLPGANAPAIAEIMRRNADLQEVPLVRVLAADETSEAPEFDADHTLEVADLPDALGPILGELGVGQSPSAGGAPAKASAPAPTPAAPAAPPAVAPAAKPSGALDEVKAAERLARIVVSDIVLYNEEKFEQGSRGGNVAELLAAELEEASALFRDRVSQELRSQREFLVEELERRAAKHREAAA